MERLKQIEEQTKKAQQGDMRCSGVSLNAHLSEKGLSSKAMSTSDPFDSPVLCADWSKFSLLRLNISPPLQLLK